MCGRFAMNKETDDLIQEYVARGGDFHDWRPRYNIAPTDTVPVIREHDGERRLAGVRWGIVPPSSPTFGGGKPIINARIETVTKNKLFATPFAEHPCIVPALGYYEWRATPDGKQPYFVHAPEGDMAMAGIIRPWFDRAAAQKAEQEGEEIDPWLLSMAVITLDAHVAPGEVHDRMPAFLSRDAIDEWLGGELDPDDRVNLLQLTSLEVADRLEYHPVSRDVNSVRNEGPHLVEPIEETPQPALF
ncbi:SOS response-associated peptidase [Salinibacterium sp. SYSU T00001]|uniref:SOS response-associated peptidase n=1 Tax=Homoserinimonas sedimenticola TaxID=2986805 RepID=UPI0022358316|nr:SOS response-associated peptidase [Salinibacterium sedimenticola]MCW4386429.1 SOS response-associated peptidase [Salinibacterium sedimenticola]